MLKLFNNKTRLLKYVNSILIGIPIWFVIGILFTFSPEFGRAMGIDQPIDAGTAVTLGFTAQVLGNLTSGFLSQYLQSRKKVILLFILSSFLLVLVYLLYPSIAPYYFIYYAHVLDFSVAIGRFSLPLPLNFLAPISAQRLLQPFPILSGVL